MERVLRVRLQPMYFTRFAIFFKFDIYNLNINSYLAIHLIYDIYFRFSNFFWSKNLNRRRGYQFVKYFPPPTRQVFLSVPSCDSPWQCSNICADITLSAAGMRHQGRRQAALKGVGALDGAESLCLPGSDVWKIIIIHVYRCAQSRTESGQKSPGIY